MFKFALSLPFPGDDFDHVLDEVDKLEVVKTLDEIKPKNLRLWCDPPLLQ